MPPHSRFVTAVVFDLQSHVASCRMILASSCLWFSVCEEKRRHAWSRVQSVPHILSWRYDWQPTRWLRNGSARRRVMISWTIVIIFSRCWCSCFCEVDGCSYRGDERLAWGDWSGYKLWLSHACATDCCSYLHMFSLCTCTCSCSR